MNLGLWPLGRCLKQKRLNKTGDPELVLGETRRYARVRDRHNLCHLRIPLKLLVRRVEGANDSIS